MKKNGFYDEKLNLLQNNCYKFQIRIILSFILFKIIMHKSIGSEC